MNNIKGYIKDAMRMIKSLGWNCEYIEEDNILETEKYIEGKDIIEYYDCGTKAEDLIDDVERNYDNFDIDYEAYIWIGKDGHGAHGAPYHIKDILSEVESHYKELEDVCVKLQEELL